VAGGGCAVGWFFWLTNLPPPRVGRGSHPPHWRRVGRQQVAWRGGVPSHQEERGSNVLTPAGLAANEAGLAANEAGLAANKQG
jgi:hypothetical protein